MTRSRQQGAIESDAFAELLRGSFVPTAIVGLAAVVVGLFSSPMAAWSAAFGAALVLGFFTVTLLAMKRTAGRPQDLIDIDALEVARLIRTERGGH